MDASCRPIVKRTYSRLAKKEQVYDSSASEKENSSFEVEVCADADMEIDVSRSIKKTKITDFFKKRSDSDSSFELSPLAKLKLESSPLLRKAKATDSSPLKKQATQMYLDLGQSGLVSTQCPDCLMHYNKSFPEDKALHTRFHSQYLKGFRFDPDDRISQELAPPPGKLISWKRYRFFSGGEALIKKLEHFLRFVSVQLGAEPLELHEMKLSHSAIIAIDASSSEIAACALFEPIKRGYLNKTDCSEASIELNDLELPAQWGISRIWTAEKHRKRGLASLLLDLKSSNRECLAFSQPTPTGFAFAKAFQSKHFNSTHCLIYLNNR
jgi:hypothetical protein